MSSQSNIDNDSKQVSTQHFSPWEIMEMLEIILARYPLGLTVGIISKMTDGRITSNAIMIGLKEMVKNHRVILVYHPGKRNKALSGKDIYHKNFRYILLPEVLELYDDNGHKTS